MKKLKIIAIWLLIIILFVLGAWFMGNYALETLNDGWREQVTGSLFGIVLWVLIIIFIGGATGLYFAIKNIFGGS